MPKGAVQTDPDGRREAVNVPVAAMGAPDGDLHRAGMVPVREAVEHHRGVGGSSRHRDRLSGSRDAVGGAETTGCAEDLRKEQNSPAPRGTAVGAAGRQKRNDTDIADRERCRLTVTTVPTSPGFGGRSGGGTLGAGSTPISSSQTVWHTGQERPASARYRA